MNVFKKSVFSSLVALGLAATAMPAHAVNTATANQSAALRGWFIVNLDYPYPSQETADALGQAIGLRSRQVKTWVKYVRAEIWQTAAPATRAALINQFQDDIDLDQEVEDKESGRTGGA